MAQDQQQITGNARKRMVSSQFRQKYFNQVYDVEVLCVFNMANEIGKGSKLCKR